MEIRIGEILLLLGLFLSSQSDVSYSFRAVASAQKIETQNDDRGRHACQDCTDEEDKVITATYTDTSGAYRMYTIKSKDLSSSWVWKSSSDVRHETKDEDEKIKWSSPSTMGSSEDGDGHATQDLSPQKHLRLKLREARKIERAADLAAHGRESPAVAHSKDLDKRLGGRYSVWRREYENQKPDATLKLMKDQIIMAKAYASIAHSKNDPDLYKSLLKHIKASRNSIGEANSDADLKPGFLEQAKKMGSILLIAKDKLYSCSTVGRKLRAMLQYQEENVIAVKRRSSFLTQLAAKTVPKPLHCLSLRLTTDYYSQGYAAKEMPNSKKLEDRSLYHYAIFSDNVLATSVVVNSTASHAEQPEKHVFHIVTDGLNFAAMRMWFLVNAPPRVTVSVENIDTFKWLNASYCSVLRQLESSRIKEYYFKSDRPSSLSDGHDNLKYRNPKYLSMLNHLRFYLPEVYPKLDKILFLDDDVVVQKDLSPLWSVDMKGLVNGAVETCKESFHRFDTYLNFSHPLISKNFSPRACGWAFGMNLFDLQTWRRKNITGIYHYWQDQNEDRTLWKLGSLPPGLITFYNLTYPLDRSWHVLGLGYDSGVEIKEIEGAAVVHYNGNYKPWLDLAIVRFRKYWSRFVNPANPHIRACRAAFD
ncbi:putative galacturonosyltransferase 3 [Wolffia australiana]